MPFEEQDIKQIADDFKFFITERQDAKLRTLLLSLHPSDVAELIERLDDGDEQAYLINLMDTAPASEAIVELDEVTREQVVAKLGNRRLSELIGEMDSDDAADFVSELPEEAKEAVLEHIESADEEEVRQLLTHKEDTAGGIMALEIVAVPESCTVDEAIGEIRKKAEEVGEIYNVYVVDGNGKLVGLVNIKDLILARGQRRISEVMNTDFLAVPVTMDQEEVANLARKYDLVSIPVVDDQDRLLGRITIDDLLDVVEEETTEDIHKMAGLTDEEEVRETAVFRIVRARIPWLVWGLLGGLISAGVMYKFEASLQQEIVLAYFVPVIMAMAGNIGIQSSTIVVRGLATGEIVTHDLLWRFLREIRIAVLNGLILSTILFIVIYVGWHRYYERPLILAMLISSALMTIILVAGILGSIIPLALKKLNVDPALATGPFITTSNDIIGLLVYLSIASFFLTR